MPFGFLTSGKGVQRWYDLDPVTGYVYPAPTSSDTNINQLNIHAGAAAVFAYPLTGSLQVNARVEYTVSITPLADFFGEDVRPSNLLFKIGAAYTFGKSGR